MDQLVELWIDLYITDCYPLKSLITEQIGYLLVYYFVIFISFSVKTTTFVSLKAPTTIHSHIRCERWVHLGQRHTATPSPCLLVMTLRRSSTLGEMAWNVRMREGIRRRAVREQESCHPPHEGSLGPSVWCDRILRRYVIPDFISNSTASRKGIARSLVHVPEGRH